ncbi:MAG: HprK-related kinase A [Proteobacteria bacterium]|nr:HprK-related kinase A [Pseudomonadota bacterium]
MSLNEFGSFLGGRGLGVQIGPFSALVRTDIGSLTEPLYRLYEDYPLLPQDSVYSFHARLLKRRASPRFYRRLVRFSVDGRTPHEDMPAAQALPVLEWGLNLVVALRCHCFLMLHSAVLERNGRALLLPAAPGDGKTTLCAGLAHRGWRILSDEFGLIRPDTCDMIPIPRPMALKNESIDIIREFAPDAYIGPATPNTRKGTVAHVKPTEDSIARQSEAAPATMIVFPRWVAEAELSLREMTKGEGFMRLATNAFNYELLGEAAFRTVRDIVTGARCYRLVYSDLEEATTRLGELAESDEQ